MKRLLDRLNYMISTLLVVLFWLVVALAPIAILLFALRLADKRQRRRSKHLREPESLDH